MKKRQFGVVIQVRDLDQARVFYRDVLGLGEPVLDSSFAVEFTLSDDFAVVLEKTEAVCLNPAGAAQCWMMRTGNLAELLGRLRSEEIRYYPANRPEADYIRVSDPEGNVILIGE